VNKEAVHIDFCSCLAVCLFRLLPSAAAAAVAASACVGGNLNFMFTLLSTLHVNSYFGF
jgi:hypothetical protein